MTDDEWITGVQRRHQRLFKSQDNLGRFLKVAVLTSKMVRFAFQNGAFCNAKWCVLQNDTQRGMNNAGKNTILIHLLRLQIKQAKNDKQKKHTLLAT